VHRAVKTEQRVRISVTYERNVFYVPFNFADLLFIFSEYAYIYFKMFKNEMFDCDDNDILDCESEIQNQTTFRLLNQ